MKMTGRGQKSKRMGTPNRRNGLPLLVASRITRKRVINNLKLAGLDSHANGEPLTRQDPPVVGRFSRNLLVALDPVNN